MTTLKRKVERDFLSPAWRRQIIIELDPAGYIRLRQKRCRKKYSISIEALFYLLVKQGEKNEAHPHRLRRRVLR
jgi:hypothetical protein